MVFHFDLGEVNGLRRLQFFFQFGSLAGQEGLSFLGVFELRVFAQVAVAAGLLDGCHIFGHQDINQLFQLGLGLGVTAQRGDVGDGFAAAAFLLYLAYGLRIVAHDLDQQALAFALVQQRLMLDAAHQGADGVRIAHIHDLTLEFFIIDKQLHQIALGAQVIALHILVQGFKQQVGVGQIFAAALALGCLPEPKVMLGTDLAGGKVGKYALGQQVFLLRVLGQQFFDVSPQPIGQFDGGVDQVLAAFGQLCGGQPGGDKLQRQLVGLLDEKLLVAPQSGSAKLLHKCGEMLAEQIFLVQHCTGVGEGFGLFYPDCGEPENLAQVGQVKVIAGRFGSVFQAFEQLVQVAALVPAPQVPRRSAALPLRLRVLRLPLFEA